MHVICMKILPLHGNIFYVLDVHLTMNRSTTFHWSDATSTNYFITDFMQLQFTGSNILNWTFCGSCYILYMENWSLRRGWRQVQSSLNMCYYSSLHDSASCLFSTSLSRGLYCTRRLAVAIIQGRHSALLGHGCNSRTLTNENSVWSLKYGIRLLQ